VEIFSGGKVMKKFLMILVVLTAFQPVFAGGRRESAGKKNVVYYSWAGGAEQQIQEAVVKDFMESHPDINVELNFVTWDEFIPKLNTMFAAQNPPDVFMVPEYLNNEWGEKGQLEDVAPLYRQRGIDVNTFFLSQYLFKNSRGNVWGVMAYPAIIFLFYNKDLFREAGVPFPPTDSVNPWTWDEFVEAAKRLTKDSSGRTPNDPGFNYDNIVQFGARIPTGWNPYLSFLYNGGTSIANSTGTELAIASPAGYRVIQSLADLALVHKVAPTVALARTSAFSSASTMLMNGQLAMLFEGCYAYGNYENENFDVGIAPIPTFTPGQGRSMTWAAGRGLKKGASAEAFEFYMYIADANNYINSARKHNISVSGLLPWTSNTYSDPNLNAAWLSCFPQEFTRAAQDITTRSAVVAENITLKNFSEIMDQGVTPALDRVWLGEETAEQALSRIRADVSAKLQGVW
jgi:multiple sugar transport system substrate-binding protein